jgi:hypothetical protein
MSELNIKKIDQLIQSVKYEDLSVQERQLMTENGIEKEVYIRLHSMHVALIHEQDLSISTNQKKELVRAFKRVHSKNIFGYLTREIPAYWQIGFSFIAFLIGYLLMPEKIVEREKLVQLPPKVIVDTLLVQSPPDTIIIEKYRLKEVPVYITKYIESESQETNLTGSNIASQQKLKQLLVAGD